MKRKYWLFISITVFVILTFSYLNVNQLNVYFILKNQQKRIEENTFLIFQTINQYNSLFGSIPASFENEKLKVLLNENLDDDYLLKLEPKILCNSSNQMYYVYLSGPDGINDSLKVTINEGYIPTKSSIIKLSFLDFIFSHGDIILGNSSFFVDCTENKRRFVYVDSKNQIIVENDSFRKAFYSEINNYNKKLIYANSLSPGVLSFKAFCSIKFDGESVFSDVICLNNGNASTVKNYLTELAYYLKGRNFGINEVYFPIIINEALIESPNSEN